MGFLRNVVMLVAAGAAANMVLKARREGLAARRGAGAATPSSLGYADPGRDSPDGAERLQAEGVARAVGGGASTDRPFDSNAHDGAEAKVPGLADVPRGG